MEFKKVKFINKKNEYGDVFSFFFEKEEINYEAGQYVHVMVNNGEEKVVRELSFASNPHEENILFTMHLGSKSSFKSSINELKEGEEITLFKIKGKLEFPIDNEKNYVFLSGGVGITPYRSILKQNFNKKLNIKLAQVQRNNKFLFKNEIEPLVNEYYGIHPDNFDKDITKVINDNKSAIFYICGSKRFVDGATKLLKNNKIDDNRIQVENFTKEKKENRIQ